MRIRGACLRFIGVAVFGLGLVPLHAAAADSRTRVMSFDSSRSRAEFEIKLFWVVPTHGEFAHVSGSIATDPVHRRARIDAHIDARAVSLGNARREAWVTSEEFFDVARFPEIHFVAESVALDILREGGLIDGQLTLRGVTRPVEFEVETNDCAESGRRDCPVVAKGQIRRSDFGMHSQRATLSDKVALRFEIYIAPAGAKARP